MAFSSDDLAELDALIGANAEGLCARLRARFPRLSVTRCDASDVDTETPFREYRELNLYLLDATDHCAHITPDPARATGVVLAARKADV